MEILFISHIAQLWLEVSVSWSLFWQRRRVSPQIFASLLWFHDFVSLVLRCVAVGPGRWCFLSRCRWLCLWRLSENSDNRLVATKLPVVQTWWGLHVFTSGQMLSTEQRQQRLLIRLLLFVHSVRWQTVLKQTVTEQTSCPVFLSTWLATSSSDFGVFICASIRVSLLFQTRLVSLASPSSGQLVRFTPNTSRQLCWRHVD